MRQVMPIAIVTDEAQRSSVSTYLQARCSIAKAGRTFRLDRIETLSDAATGETLSVPDWVSKLELGAGRPFSWSGEVQDIPDDVSTVAPIAQGKYVAWRAIVIASLIGYAIGRLRIVAFILHQFHVRHGWWL